MTRALDSRLRGNDGSAGMTGAGVAIVHERSAMPFHVEHKLCPLCVFHVKRAACAERSSRSTCHNVAGFTWNRWLRRKSEGEILRAIDEIAVVSRSFIPDFWMLPSGSPQTSSGLITRPPRSFG
jgi:hypothetical protein